MSSASFTDSFSSFLFAMLALDEKEELSQYMKLYEARVFGAPWTQPQESFVLDDEVPCVIQCSLSSVGDPSKNSVVILGGVFGEIVSKDGYPKIKVTATTISEYVFCLCLASVFQDSG
jgi:hypothetical protein